MLQQFLASSQKNKIGYVLWVKVYFCSILFTATLQLSCYTVNAVPKTGLPAAFSGLFNNMLQCVTVHRLIVCAQYYKLIF